MTAIAAIKTDTKVYLGADSQVTAGWTKDVMVDSKLFRLGDFVIGFSGDLRDGQKIRHTLSLPPWRPKWRPWRKPMELEPYLCGPFADALKKLELNGFGFLLGYKNRLFSGGSDFAFVESAEYAATGSGGELALGSLASTSGEETRRRLEKALTAAARHDIGVGGHFTYMETE